jgi:predicted CoA-binding protein
MKTVAIVGASADRRKYGNKAVRAFVAQGYRVVPIHPAGGIIEGLPAYPSLLDVPFAVDMASFYVPPAVGLRVVEDVARKSIPELWLNPGSDGPEVVARAQALGLAPVVACSILGIGDTPSRY